MKEALLYSKKLQRYFLYSKDLDAFCKGCLKSFYMSENAQVVKRYDLNFNYSGYELYCLNCRHLIKRLCHDAVVLAEINNFIDESMHLCDLDLGMREVKSAADLGLRNSTPTVKDRTRYAGRESLQGASIGISNQEEIKLIDKKLKGVSVLSYHSAAAKLDQPFNIDEWAEQMRTSKPLLESEDTLKLENKEAKKHE